jgi:hypothetical protein
VLLDRSERSEERNGNIPVRLFITSLAPLAAVEAAFVQPASAQEVLCRKTAKQLLVIQACAKKDQLDA